MSNTFVETMLFLEEIQVMPFQNSETNDNGGKILHILWYFLKKQQIFFFMNS